MGALELKTDLHKLLDTIENEQLLRTIYDFLKQRENSGEGELWNSLTEAQKEEVFLSYEESEQDDKLIAWEVLKGKR